MIAFASILNLMLVQGTLGAIDTVYYHELVYDLPANASDVKAELKLHAARDFLYGCLYLTLPFFSWSGVWAYVLAAIFLAEIGITLSDFSVEDQTRLPWGGIAKGERSMHTIIAILYGGFLALILPYLLSWAALPTGFAFHGLAQGWQKVIFPTMGIVAIGSGLRDLGAQAGIQFCQRSLFPVTRFKLPKNKKAKFKSAQA